MPTQKERSGLDRTRPLLYSSLAQLVEHAAVNRRVVGSSPTWGAMLRSIRFSGASFLFSDNCTASLIRHIGVFHSAVLKVFPSVRYGMLRYRAVGDSEAPERDSNIVYGFHLIPIYNRAQFVDKTDPCYSTSRRQGRCGQVPLWNAIRI